MRDIKASELSKATDLWRERTTIATHIEQLEAGGRLSFHVDYAGSPREVLVAPVGMTKLKDQILVDLKEMVEDCDKRLARMGVEID
jgi:hypothetical protein